MNAPQSIKARVSDLLRRCRIVKPPVPAEKIARNLGVRIQSGPLDDELSGFLYRSKKAQKPIIGVNSLHALVRQRFTIAHELAHLLLHEDSEVYVDRDFSIYFRNRQSSSAEERREIQANRFAAELLMPEEFVRKDFHKMKLDLGDESQLMILADKYKVSLQALIIRLNNLGYLRSI